MEQEIETQRKIAMKPCTLIYELETWKIKEHAEIKIVGREMSTFRRVNRT